MITISSITPSKNAQNVDINQDIVILISADFKLDPRNISFKINEVDIVPNAFSVYNETNNSYELEVTLYTRKRIKYNTGRRYGQDGMRYGMRDAFPSMLQYASRYVIEFTVWGDEETLTDRFVFTTQEGVFYNQNPVDYFYSDATQGMANYFPEWSKSRYDKFSNLQQIINPLGQDLERIQDFVTQQGMNNFLQTANLNQLSGLHKIELGKDFEITSTLNEDGTLFFVQPEVSGIQDITRYDLFTSSENNINKSFYESYPTRINGDRLALGSNIIHGPVPATEIRHLVETELKRPGAVCIKATGLKSSIYKTEKETILLVKCRIYGKTLFDLDQTEDMILLNDREIMTTKLWSYIDSIEFFNLYNQDIEFELKYFRGPQSMMQDKKFTTTYEDNRESILWKAEDVADRTLLQKHITIGESSFELLRNSGLTKAIQEYELLDIDNQTSLKLIDIAVDPFSNYLYGVDQDYLYVFDKRESYPERLKEISGDNGLGDFVIELDTDETGLDEDGQKEILFKLIHKAPGKTIVRYRIRLKKPDGTELFITSTGTYTTDMNQASIFVKQNDILLDEKQYSFTADQIGEYIIELETIYKKGESSRHRQLFRVLSNSAQVKYKLKRIVNEEIPTTLVIDHDQKLKILTDQGSLFTIELHHDGVMIDYDNKILYFIEEYESVDVG